MHILPREEHSLDEADQAVDLAQSAADFVFLSFTDSDLALIASAAEAAGETSLRLAPLARLKHPLSVDLYVESVLSKAKVVLIRILGGLDYWRYGAEQAALAAERSGATLIIVPGCDKADERLHRYSTVPADVSNAIWRCFLDGGIENAGLALGWMKHLAGRGQRPEAARPLPKFASVRHGRQLASEATRQPPLSPLAGRGEVRGAGRDDGFSKHPISAVIETAGQAPHPASPRKRGEEKRAARLLQRGEEKRAAIVHYRALSAAGDMAGVTAMRQALQDRGFETLTISLASTKEADCAAFLAAELKEFAPDIIINTTSFSARGEDGMSPFDAAGCVVLQSIFSNRSAESWRRSSRGIGATDLAMNIAMPEIDGRIATRIIAFREEETCHPLFQCALRRLQPMPDRVAFVADQALALANLRRLPNAQKKIALILNDYPGAAGRAGHAVGLDGPASAVAILERLKKEGYAVTAPPSDVMERLEAGERLQLGNILLALQPPRAGGDRKTQYHDAALAPDPAYVTFYDHLRHDFRADAIIHLGAHGTLEWLPGKAAALSADCWPERLIGPTPVIYPFIVSDPGEAAQAKRRLSAVTIGHLTPPMTEAGLHGEAQIIETLLEEYSSAADLDPRRAKLLEAEILDRAASAGLLRELGGGTSLANIDAWLCDLKEMRVKDGLHVFGALPDAARDALAANIAAGAEGMRPDHAASFDTRRSGAAQDEGHSEVSGLMSHHAPHPEPSQSGMSKDAQRLQIDRSVRAEMDALIAALEGRFVPPGPSGAPSRGRIDVLPTGRNMTTLDPRQSPTVAAESLGRRAAEAIIAQHLQEHGDWPKSLVIDAWGSAAIRTGGEEIAQALALLGVRLKRDTGSDRINGFEVLSLTELGRPRSDITLRISGLYRDIFQHQISLFDAAVQAVARRDEPADENPLAGAARGLSGQAFRLATLRVFGPAPESYGTGLEAMVLGDRGEDAGAAHIAAGGFAYGSDLEGSAAQASFRERLTASDGLIHAIDMHEADLLEAPDYAYSLGGYIAASADRPVYILDSRTVGTLTVRPLRHELARTVRARAANPRWIEGLMRHGHRGAAEIAQTLDSLFAFAALGASVEEHQFDLLHRAYLEDERVAEFLAEQNPRALAAIEQRFAESVRRGLWQPRRNSIAMRYSGREAA